MIDEILRNNLIIREWVNGGLLPLNLSLVVVIGLFLWASWKEAAAHSGRLTGAVLDFQRMEGVQTACALWWIFLADAIRAASAWAVLNFRLGVVSDGPVAPTMALIEWVNAGFIVAGVVGLIASLRCIYLFSPPTRRHWYWMASVAATAVFQIVT